jgi:membrane complex biogenesis BtpA family protein
MSALLDAIAAGRKPMIGMIQLRPLAGSSRYAGEPLERVLQHALDQAALLRDAGFGMLMVQNLGDLPVAQRADAAQVAWMTRIAREIRAATDLPLGLNLLENDVDAMFAVASAAALDFVRIKVFVGAMLSPGGIESGRAFEAVRARTSWHADGIAIFADIYDRTSVPLATAGLADDLRTAFDIGGADGVVLTGRSHRETMDFLAVARAAFPERPLLVGGGASAATIAEIAVLADGAIVSSALKSNGSLFGDLEPQRAREFMAAAAVARRATVRKDATSVSPDGAQPNA